LPFTEELKSDFRKANETLGGCGERVLGFCEKMLPLDKFPVAFEYNTDKPNFPLEDMVFCGLISLIDPPRETVPHAVAKCKEAGIKVGGVWMCIEYVVLGGVFVIVEKLLSMVYCYCTGDYGDWVFFRKIIDYGVFVLLLLLCR